jgi:hypothetical protein
MQIVIDGSQYQWMIPLTKKNERGEIHSHTAKLHNCAFA